MPSRLTLCFISIVALAAFSVATEAAPLIRFEPRALVVDRLPHGATVAWFGIAHEPQAYHLRVREYAGIETDGDRDGTVRIELQREISPDSAWAIVDTTSGVSVVAQPDGGVVRLKPLPRPRFARSGGAAKIAEDDPYLKFWLVRGGRGAWVHTAEDGGSGDGDGLANGIATAKVSEFTAVADSPAPPTDLQRGDIVIVVDPWQLRIAETSVRDEDVNP